MHLKIVTAIMTGVLKLDYHTQLQQEDVKMREEFPDRFHSDLPRDDELPADIFHKFVVLDLNFKIKCCLYNYPKKYSEMVKEMLDKFIATGLLVPSNSLYASPVCA